MTVAHDIGTAVAELDAMPTGRRCACGAAIAADAHPKQKWCTDRCRRQTLYGGICERCGATTNGSNGAARAAKFCGTCSRDVQRESATWTRERIIADGERWISLTGRAPVGSDWNIHQARGERRALLERYHHLTGPWPHMHRVQELFGSWRAFIGVLGAEAFPAHHGGRGTPRAARVIEMRELVRQAERTGSPADDGASS